MYKKIDETMFSYVQLLQAWEETCETLDMREQKQEDGNKTVHMNKAACVSSKQKR